MKLCIHCSDVHLHRIQQHLDAKAYKDSKGTLHIIVDIIFFLLRQFGFRSQTNWRLVCCLSIDHICANDIVFIYVKRLKWVRKTLIARKTISCQLPHTIENFMCMDNTKPSIHWFGMSVHILHPPGDFSTKTLFVELKLWLLLKRVKQTKTAV